MLVSLSDINSSLPYRELEQFVFLAGSGISVPSGLPSGWEFNKGLVEFLSASQTEAEELLSLIAVGYGSDSHTVRFEQVMYILRERIDAGLSILRCFDGGHPTMLHYFLAHALRQDAFVFTTNFDSLIEAAFEQGANEGDTILQIYLEEELEEQSSLSCRSFAQYLRLGLPRPALLKLHGTLRDIRRGRQGSGALELSSLGATLDRIGAQGGAMRLEPYKQATLEATLKGRVLCVLGYSGADDFDVVPSLTEALAGAAGLLWIRHENRRAEVIDLTHEAESDLLPAKLKRAASETKSFVIRGRTDQIIFELFNFSLPRGDQGAATPSELPSTSFASYFSLRQEQKKIVSARIAEEALRLDIALARYNDAISLARVYNPPAHAYALFRSGHIMRIDGNDGEALSRLKRALRIFRRLNDHANTSLVLNAIGNTYLVRGELSRAEMYYEKCLAEGAGLGNRRLEATVMNNIGLIWKKRGNLELSIEYYDRALEIDTEIRDRAGMARDLGNKVNALVLLGRFAEAIDICDEVSDIQRLLGRLDLLANSFISRSIALRHLDRLDEAEQAACAALNIEQDIGRKEGMARCASVFGGIAASRRNWTEAIAKYQESLAIQAALGRREGLAIDNESLGECYLMAGDLPKAAAAFRASHDHYKFIGNRRKAAEMERRALATTTDRENR